MNPFPSLRRALLLAAFAAAIGWAPAAAQPAAEPPAAAEQEPPPAAEAEPSAPAEDGPPPVQPLSDDLPEPAPEPPAEPEPAPEPEPLTVSEFYEQLVGVPLCGRPETGPMQGRPLCTVHLPDGTAVLAGPGILLRGIWEIDEEGRVCRRNIGDPIERRRCITYQRLDQGLYRNSDGIEVCVGPCGP